MDFKRYLPYISAVVIFWVITAVFFSPLVFDNKRIKQGDIEHYQGVSKEINDYRDKTGKEPLWTNSMFGGMPAYQISIKYPNDYVQYFQKTFIGLMPAPATIIFLCMVGFYFLLTTMKVDPWISIAGAIAFGFSSYFVIIITAGHNTKGFAIAYMAPVLMGILLTMRGRLWLGAALTAIALALEIYSNHLQITYYLLILVGLVTIGEAVRLYKEKKIKYLVKSIALLGVAAIIALLPNLTNLVLTEEYGNYSTRGQSDITVDNKEQKKTSGLPIEYATQWSYGTGESFTLMVPNFYGGASEPIANYDKNALKNIDDNWKENIGQAGAYFGDQPFTSGPVYAGAIVCFLFLLGMFIVKDNLKWWLLGATVLSIALAWGKNAEGLTEFFFYHIPGYNKFRAVSMILVIAELTMPLLAMLAVREIVNDPAGVKARMKRFYIAFGVTAGLCFLFAVTPGTFVTPVNDDEVKQINASVAQQGLQKQVANEYIQNLEDARLAIVTGDAWRSFFFIVLAGGMIFLYVRKPFGIPLFAGGLAVLMLLDMAIVGRRYISNDNYEPKTEDAAFTPTKADEMILQDKSPDYRVLNVAAATWQDATTSYFHKSIGGYHGAKLKRVQELYEQVMENDIAAVTSAIKTGNDSITQAELAKHGSLNMLNTRYIIFNPDAGGVTVNRHACGNAWFVSKLNMVPNADEEIKAVKNFSPRRTAFVDQQFSSTLGGFTPHYDSTASIKLTSYEPNDLKYESHSSAEGLAVFSEIYYDKGWKAYIDGQETPHVRADFVLRAMKVPAGKHEIEFKFEPDFYFKGEKIALAGSIMLFLFIGLGIFMDRREQLKAEAGESEAA